MASLIPVCAACPAPGAKMSAAEAAIPIAVSIVPPGVIPTPPAPEPLAGSTPPMRVDDGLQACAGPVAPPHPPPAAGIPAVRAGLVNVGSLITGSVPSRDGLPVTATPGPAVLG
ncbi:Uncharacterised protein [Mycobacteroides abscessus subsp. abscessus]|nr:Uncharacterised protein [Mycobacteroides abscessus subsp. abscessus]